MLDMLQWSCVAQYVAMKQNGGFYPQDTCKVKPFQSKSGFYPLVGASNSYLSSNCVIGVNESISIGTNVMVADAVSIRDTNHNFQDIKIPMKDQGINTSPMLTNFISTSSSTFPICEIRKM